MKQLEFHNRQRARSISRPRLAKLTKRLLADLTVEASQLSVVFVDAREMASINQNFLNHAGPTDVITFDYSEGVDDVLCGEIFICVPVAVTQAREFKTTWQSEIIRYLIHGILHLYGYDDTTPAARLKMKAKENTLLKKLTGKKTLRLSA